VVDVSVSHSSRLRPIAGDTVEAVVLYVDTGVEATARLVAFFDSDITGAPLTPDGTNVRITVPTGGWFRL
jgi:hypothetical protein